MVARVPETTRVHPYQPMSDVCADSGLWWVLVERVWICFFKTTIALFESFVFEAKKNKDRQQTLKQLAMPRSKGRQKARPTTSPASKPTHMCCHCSTSFTCQQAQEPFWNNWMKRYYPIGTCLCSRVGSVEKPRQWHYYCGPCAIQVNLPE